ncbi:MAG: ATP-grasp domain-containing protein [Burkholderiales bacterium]
MMLLEHDAKVVASVHGLHGPGGVLAESINSISGSRLPPGPWVVKAQVPAGGRGKAGLIQPAVTIDEVKAHVRAMTGAMHRGHMVRGCRIESTVVGMREAYAALMIHPAAAAVQVMLSERGGVDIEAMHRHGAAVMSAMAAPEPVAIARVVEGLTAAFDPRTRVAMIDAFSALTRVFFECEATLVEVNPLFIADDGTWTAGDLKLAIDESALVRRPTLAALVEARRLAYPEAALKLTTGFDYVEVDREGTIGLLTTGAGLSMMLIDELRAKGHRPFNFVDIRTGQFRGNPTRLIQVLSWLARGAKVKVVLVNVFAGITHLGEFARLFVEALEAVPGLKIPIVARLIGNGFDEARGVLVRDAEHVILEQDLDRAIEIVASYA